MSIFFPKLSLITADDLISVDPATACVLLVLLVFSTKTLDLK